MDISKPFDKNTSAKVNEEFSKYKNLERETGFYLSHSPRVIRSARKAYKEYCHTYHKILRKIS